MVMLSHFIHFGLVPLFLHNAAYDDTFKEARHHMVTTQIQARNIKNPALLQAMNDVPRHRFIEEKLHARAYADLTLPIGYGQTISQPYIVAFMIETANLIPSSRVLEIGTGSGYEAAILSRLCKDVFTIEIIEPLANTAVKTFEELGYKNIHVKVGDGYYGWIAEAPFDAIILSAAPTELPLPLLKQLKNGGVILMSIGQFHNQKLVKYTKSREDLIEEVLMPVRFVPMTGKAQHVGK